MYINKTINNKENIQKVEKLKISNIENLNVDDTENEWQIEIPKINLKAQIQEGTTKEILNEYVGHFERTNILYGNVGLAAHNRGYNVNYFKRVKELEMGDLIIYKYKNNIITYEVNLIEKIEDTNWEYLKNTKENKITLITCVENEPEYRRCIQGKEVKIFN